MSEKDSSRGLGELAAQHSVQVARRGQADTVQFALQHLIRNNNLDALWQTRLQPRYGLCSADDLRARVCYAHSRKDGCQPSLLRGSLPSASALANSQSTLRSFAPTVRPTAQLKVEALSTYVGVTLTVLNAKVRQCLSVWQQF